MTTYPGAGELDRSRSRASIASGQTHELTKVLSPTLAASWDRSMQYGLRREDKALFAAGVSRKAAKNFDEENQLLREHASPEMTKLYAGLSSSRWLALCMNTSGRIICAVGDRASAPAKLRVLMQPGRSLAEAELGTTAPGCVLKERRAVMVNRTEHFLLELHDFVCASAPIFGPAGELIGALDISGIEVDALPLAADMVGFAVRRIENSIVAALDDCVALRFHCDDRLLGSPMEGILAVDREGVIRGFNRAARQLLPLPDSCRVGTTLDSLFEDSFDRIVSRTNSGERKLVKSLAGPATFVSVDHLPRTPAQLSSATSKHRVETQHQDFIVHDETLHADYRKAVRILSHGLPVLIQGETGTGKEVVARALKTMVRPHTRFMALNCAAIPESLIESELFGYADGSFTGARKGGAPGKLEQANGGVLFLDEIGDMPLAMQSRLLRVLQERSVMRLGSSEETPIDVLIICATHHQLTQLVAEGKFREDLYYRLNGHTLQMPPLRTRTDIVEIVIALLRRWSNGSSSSTTDLQSVITERALTRITEYSWPGNIRQLENVIRALLAMRDDGPIDLIDLPDFLQQCLPSNVDENNSPHQGKSLEAVQIRAIRAAVQTHRGNISSAARALGISRGTLYKKLRLTEN